MTDQILPRLAPTARQLEFQDWEFGLFLHFGIRTFYEGYRDFDGQPMSPAAFQPAALDCAQWVTTAKEAGVRYMVLTAKHHDGFANWPSRYTDFSVASSPWKGGKGDVVREFTDACHAQDMKVGLYYSPADASSPIYNDPKAYDDYFLHQISELLTGYGGIDVLWFDGCGSGGHEYDWRRIMGEIRRMQPQILIFNMGDPDYRWVGNEDGIAPAPCFNVAETVPFAVDTDETGRFERRWLPTECDCRMRQRNWFYSDADEDTVKGVEELMGLYHYSVGRGCNLLLNIGPDRRGLLPDKDAARLREFGAEVRRRFGKPLTALADWTRTGNTWTYTPPEPLLIDGLVAQEDLSGGESVQKFAVHIAPANFGDPITVYEGHSVGHKSICAFPLVAARQVIFEVRASEGPAALRSLALYDAPPA